MFVDGVPDPKYRGCPFPPLRHTKEMNLTGEKSSKPNPKNLGNSYPAVGRNYRDNGLRAWGGGIVTYEEGDGLSLMGGGGGVKDKEFLCPITLHELYRINPNGLSPTCTAAASSSLFGKYLFITIIKI